MSLPSLSLLALLLALASSSVLAAQPLPLIPRPAHIERADGRFPLAGDTPLFVAADDAAARDAADFLLAALQAVDGPRLHLTHAHGRQPMIRLLRDPHADTAAEGYRLDIAPDGVRLSARGRSGLVHGAATLFQLLTRGEQVRDLPALHIQDAPRFGWRGLLLDSARHLQSPAEIRRLIDQMALHKLNVLHWHLTDDQGWRIEIRRYPELTRIGAWRTPPQDGRGSVVTPYGGFYTQQDIRDLVRYAAARGIDIVPELDLPGHATAAIAAYPRLGSTSQRLAVSPDWGVLPNLYNVDEATFDFLEHVLDEVMALFPSRYIHLGGDEAIKTQWKASPAVQARMRALGLTSEEQLQGWFMERLGRYLARHGRRMIGWDEILDGKLPADATVMSWRGSAGARKAAQQGHDVVLSPAPQLYLDYLQSTRQDELTGRLPVQTLADLYAFEPVDAGMTAPQARHVLGAQANVWSEHMPSFAHIEHAVFPRLAALAEVQWSPRETRDFNDFLQRMPAQLARYRRAGIAYADSAFAPAIALDDERAVVPGRRRVTLSNQSHFGTLRYTIDGSEPGVSAPIYRQPFEIDPPVTVRVAVYDAAQRLLAAPRQRTIDRAPWLTRGSGDLHNCPGSDFRLRVQPTPDATSLQPVYTLPLFNACQVWPQAPLDGIAGIELQIARLPDNYQLADEAKLVVRRTPETAHGELRLYRDRCDGPRLASLPLPDPLHSERRFTLHAPLSESGVHDLCLAFATPAGSPLYVFARSTLQPRTTP